MKQQAIQYLALDVHEATSVATVREAGGTIRMRATVPTEAKAIVGLVKGLGRPVHVTFEEGTHAQWLHDLLQPHAERVVVCNVRGRERDLEQKRSDRRRLALRAASSERAQVRPSRIDGCRGAQGARSLLHEPGGRRNARDVAGQGHLSGSGGGGVGQSDLPPVAAKGVAREA